MPTVLHLTIQGFANNRNEGQVSIATSFKIARTGLPLIADGPDIVLQMRNGGGGGTHKPPSALNSECLAAVLAYIQSQYGITSFDATYVCGSVS